MLFIFIFMLYFSYLCFLYSYSCYIFHIHVFIFTFTLYFLHSYVYIHIHVIFFYSWLCYAWFCSFIFMVYFHGMRESGCTISHSYSARQKEFYVLTIPDNAFWPGDSSLDQPRFHLKFADDVMPSITSTISHNFALSNQRLSWPSGMSFALHRSGHRFGPPSGQIFMFVTFSVVRFSVCLCASTFTQGSNKKKITCKLWPQGDKNLP